MSMVHVLNCIEGQWHPPKMAYLKYCPFSNIRGIMTSHSIYVRVGKFSDREIHFPQQHVQYYNKIPQHLYITL
jgi:hypothetical protein